MQSPARWAVDGTVDAATFFRPPWCVNSWAGVTCDDKNYNVVDLDLDTNELGTALLLSNRLPSTIGALTALKSLSLNGQKVFGTIPTALATISTLTYLDLKGNRYRPHPHPLTHTRSPTPAHSHNGSLSLSLSLSHTLIHSHSHLHTFSLTHTHHTPHTHAFSPSLTHPSTLSPSQNFPHPPNHPTTHLQLCRPDAAIRISHPCTRLSRPPRKQAVGYHSSHPRPLHCSHESRLGS